MAKVTCPKELPDSANKTDFYNEIDTATVTEVVNADISANAAIADTKLATITTAGKVNVTAFTIASQAEGDIVYYNGTSWTRLAIGSVGETLTVNGAGTAPEWA